jgi:hypothetical protein
MDGPLKLFITYEFTQHFTQHVKRTGSPILPEVDVLSILDLDLRLGTWYARASFDEQLALDWSA